MSVNLPPEQGQGQVIAMNLTSGLRLILSNYRFHSPTTLEYISSPTVIGFGFCLSGDISSCFEKEKNPFHIRSGKTALFCFERGRMLETIGEDRVIRVNIMVEPEKLDPFLGDQMNFLMVTMKQNNGEVFRTPGTVTPSMRSVILQILDCPYHGITQKFFLEGKALELIAYQLDQLGEKKITRLSRPGIRSDEIDKVEYAKELLLKNMTAPPNISTLSRHVGMCSSRLHQCFKEVYGMSPFEYLRYKRVETAGVMLREKKMSVTEAALFVGYSSLSHFSKLFKQQTGYLPREYQRKTGLF